MRKICVLPFTRREVPLLPSLEKRFQISSLVAPKGIAFGGENVGSLKNMNPGGYIITNDMDAGIRVADLIFLSHVPNKYQSLRKYALKALYIAANSGKEIHCFLELSDEEKKRVDMECEQSQTSITYYALSNYNKGEIVDLQRLNKFDVPVIYVGEEAPDCDGYDVFLSVAEKLISEGKNVLAISENSYNNFLGYECIKFGADLEIENQIFRLNTLIYELYRKNYPDIILIGLPKPLMKYDDESLFDCGGVAFILSQAVPGDGCIYCTHAEVSGGGTYWETFNSGILAKFGYPIICVNVSNRLIDNTGDIHLSSLRISEEATIARVENLTSSSSIPFFHIQNPNDMKDLSQLLDEYVNLPYGVI